MKKGLHLARRVTHKLSKSSPHVTLINSMTPSGAAICNTIVRV